MNIPNPDSSRGANVSENAEEDVEFRYRRLRMLTQAVAVSVLILTGTVFVFLYRQVVLVRRQTAELSRYLAEVDRSGLQGFFEQVQVKYNEFRKDNPDFNPIYFRYFGSNEVPTKARVSAVPSGGSSSPSNGEKSPTFTP